MRKAAAWALATVLATTCGAMGAVLYQIDDFEDGTTQGWVTGAPNPNPPVNVATGGPAGVGDNYLMVTGNGTVHAGGKLFVRNQTGWAGDFISAGITQMAVDLKNLNDANELVVRLSFESPGGDFVTPGVLLDVGSGWQHVVFDIRPGSLLSFGGTDANVTLASVTQMAVLHNPLPEDTGAVFAGSFGMDNIQALPEPATLGLLSLGGWMLLRRRR
jgi:hypothetical protein